MKDNELILLLIGAVVLFLIWRRKQIVAAPAIAPAAGVLGGPPAPPAGNVKVLASPITSQQAAALPKGTAFRVQTVGPSARTTQPMIAVDRSKPRPPPKAPASSTSATSRALNNSTLNKIGSYSTSAGVAAASVVGIPPAISRPIATYGNPITLAKGAVSAGKAVGNFFGGLFS